MRIALVTYSLSYQSGARAAVELAKSLAKLGHTVELICTPYLFDPILSKKLASKKIHIHKISRVITLLSLIPSLHIDIISFNGVLSQLFLCRLTNIPIFSHYYGTQFAHPLLTPLIYAKGLLLTWLPHHLYGISNYCSVQCHRLYGRKIPTIYQGSDHLSTRKPTKKEASPPELLSISRIVPYKGFHRLIPIANRLRYRLTIAGSQPNLNYLTHLQTLSTPLITIKTSILDSDLIKLYCQTTIYLSADKYLFLGLPILEAATFGIPSVVFDYAAAREVVVHNHTGFVATTDSEFSAYLQKLATSKSLLTKFGSNAKNHAKQFTWSKFANRLDQEYRIITNQS